MLKRLAVAATSGLLLLAGCGDAGSASSSGRTAVTSFYPLEYVVQRVAAGHAEVVNLTSPGVEPHDLELSVAQTAEIADADLAVYLEGFQPAIDEAIAQNRPEHTIEVSEAVTLEPAHPDDQHAHEHGHEDQASDLHFWLDPELMAQVAATVADTLSEADPDHAADYRENLAGLREDLEQLDREYRAGLESCALDTVVVSHDAFGYLEKYGLHFEAINGLSPDAEPSPAHVAELHELIEDEGITTVFSERLASAQMANTLAGDLGLQTAVLDPIEGLSDETADQDYLSLMRENLAALQKANGCS